jgi:Fe-Mn family superoxide dismutase
MTKKQLNEAYIGIAQPYSLPTDLLTQRTKTTHQSIYERAVETMNTVSFKLEGADRFDSNADNSMFRSLKRDEASALNRAFLHALYFDNISDMQSELTRNSLAYTLLERDYGTFDRWQQDFIAACLAAKNGWAVTCYNYFVNRFINVVVDEDSDGVPFGCIPVIVMDMHEHAYFHDYLGDKLLYVGNMLKELDWIVVNERFEKAHRISKILQPSASDQ